MEAGTSVVLALVCGPPTDFEVSDGELEQAWRAEGDQLTEACRPANPPFRCWGWWTYTMHQPAPVDDVEECARLAAMPGELSKAGRHPTGRGARPRA
jgi:hypothetical protein